MQEADRRDKKSMGLLALVAWLAVLGLAVNWLAGWPPSLPILPGTAPSLVELHVWLRSPVLAVDWLAPLAGIAAWVVLGWTLITVLLRVALNLLDALTRGAQWVGALRGASDWLTLPIVRRAVDASLAGILIARVAMPLTAHASSPAAVTIVVSAANAATAGGDVARTGGVGEHDWSFARGLAGQAGEATRKVSSETIYTVRPGDTWTGIASEFYGDAARAQELLDANVGRQEPGGRHITRHGLIFPGWTVSIPSPARGAVEDADGQRSYTVRPGDNLTRISADLLGDETRYPELFELNRGTRVDGVHVLTDPNLIWPGLVLRLPADELPETADAGEVSAGDPSSEGGAGSADVSAVPTPRVVETPAPAPPPLIQAAPGDSETLPAAASSTPVITSAKPALPVAPAVATTQEAEPEPPPAQEPPGHPVSPIAGGAAGAGVALAGIAAASLILRRRHARPQRIEAESDYSISGGFAEPVAVHTDARSPRADLSQAIARSAELAHAIATEFRLEMAGGADTSFLSGTVLAAVRHGRSATTLMLEHVPIVDRAKLIALLPAAATRAFGERCDVDGMVSRDGDVLVRLTGATIQTGLDQEARCGKLSTEHSPAWATTSILLPLGLLADKQVLAASWDALSNILIASPLGQGADAVLVGLLASLAAQRRADQLGIVALTRPRALPEELFDLPNFLMGPVDPDDDQASMDVLQSVRRELEHRIANGMTDAPDLVVVVGELGLLSPEAIAALNPVMVHGPRHRIRVLAGTERRALELVQHCPTLAEFGVRLVMRTMDDEESIALVGSSDATELGTGGHLLARIEGRVPIEAHGYRVAPDYLAQLAANMRNASAGLNTWEGWHSSRGSGDPVEAEETKAELMRESDAVNDANRIDVVGDSRVDSDGLPPAELAIEQVAPLLVGEHQGFVTESVVPPVGEIIADQANGVEHSSGEDFVPVGSESDDKRNGHVALAVAQVLPGLRPRLRGRFFGARELLYDDVVVWPRPDTRDEKRIELLVFLAVQDPAGVQGEAVADSLWEEDDDEARADRLRKRRYRLRIALKELIPDMEGDPIAAVDKQRPVYRLDPRVIESDVHRFLRLFDQARSMSPEHAIEAYEELLALYRGELLDRSDVPPYRWLDDGPRVLDLRVKYARMQLEARRRLADLVVGTDTGLERAEELYSGLAGEDPYDHRVWEALARLHGRRNDLLGLDSTVRRLRNALAEAGDNSDPDTVILPPALVRVFDNVRASMLTGFPGTRA